MSRKGRIRSLKLSLGIYLIAIVKYRYDWVVSKRRRILLDRKRSGVAVRSMFNAIVREAGRVKVRSCVCCFLMKFLPGYRRWKVVGIVRRSFVRSLLGVGVGGSTSSLVDVDSSSH